MSPPSPVMFDTNIASFLIRGANAVLERRLSEVPIASIVVSAVTAGELRFGVARRPASPALATAVEAFLRHVRVLPWDGHAASAYGALRASLETAGTPLGNLDTLIAAHAIEVGAVLVTNDRAFARVPGLAVQDWTVG